MFAKTNQNLKNNDSTLFFSFMFKKFLSLLMKDGKKIKAEVILKKVFVRVSLQGFSPVNVLILAVNNIKPLLEVRNVRLKGRAHQVPFPILFPRQITSSFKTILSSFNGKRKFEDFLVDELINSSLGKSQSVKTTVNLHKLASQNRLFAHFRWF
jgi:small subunit ribosomal protein S7|tara:strand:- start:868 stop:1329 length:462 start_codon:yes stop_codon:yes gene_type:complete